MIGHEQGLLCASEPPWQRGAQAAGTPLSASGPEPTFPLLI